MNYVLVNFKVIFTHFSIKIKIAKDLLGLKWTDEKGGVHLLEILESKVNIYIWCILVTRDNILVKSREKHDLNHFFFTMKLVCSNH